MMPEVISVCHLSNGKKTNPGCLGDLLGMNSFSLYVGIKIRHDIWIPMKQPGFNGKQGRFFFLGRFT